MRGDFLSLELASEEWEDAWWEREQQRMLELSLVSGEDEGELLEEEQHRPVTEVLGPWMKGGLIQPEGHEDDYPKPPAGNPDWMKEMGSVFVAGGVHITA